MKDNFHGIRTGEDRSTAQRHSPGGDVAKVVLAQDVVRLCKTCVELVGQHGIRARDDLFRGLTHQHGGAVPCTFVPREFFSHAQQNGHMDVVPAGVHHTHVFSFWVFHSHLAAVRNARLLSHG